MMEISSEHMAEIRIQKERRKANNNKRCLNNMYAPHPPPNWMTLTFDLLTSKSKRVIYM
jgi:hypothetical protein